MKRLFTLIGVLLIAGPAFAADYTITKLIPLTVAATAHAAKDNVGGLQTINDFQCQNSGGILESILVLDKAGNAVEYTAYLFDTLPTGTFTDDAAFDPDDAALVYALPFVNISSNDCKTFADNGLCSLSSLRSSANTLLSGGTFYLNLVADGTPTYASTSDVTLKLIMRCTK